MCYICVHIPDHIEIPNILQTLRFHIVQAAAFNVNVQEC